MELTVQQWGTMRKIFESAFNSSFHYAIATTNKDGTPHITPIGSLILGEDRKGFYFEGYVNALARNLQHNKRVCVLAVNSNKWSLLKSFFLGRITAPPGVRLLGTATERREATEQEMRMFRRRFRMFRPFKGYDLVWGNLRYVREIYFDSYEPVRIGALTREVWNE